MSGAVIRVDRAPAPIPPVPSLYVTRIGAVNPRGLRTFEFTRDKSEAQRLSLAAAAAVIRQLGPTECQFSVCDA